MSAYDVASLGEELNTISEDIGEIATGLTDATPEDLVIAQRDIGEKLNAGTVITKGVNDILDINRGASQIGR